MGRFPSTLVLVVALVFGATLRTCTPVFSRPSGDAEDDSFLLARNLACLVETTGVEPVVPFGRRIYSPLGLPIFLHLQNFCYVLLREL